MVAHLFRNSLPYSQETATNPVNSPPYIIKIHFNILPSMSRTSKCSLPSSFPTKIIYAYLISPMRATCFSHLTLLNSVILKSTNFESPSYAIFSTFCYLPPLRSKYSSQYPLLIRPQSTFLPPCETSNLTQKQNNR